MEVNPKLNVEIGEDFVTISLKNGIEIVHWTESEWIEDHTVATAMANAINMAYTEPDRLIKLNMEHIESQLQQDQTYFKDLRQHIGHDIVCICYGEDDKEPDNISVECETCNCVLFDVSPGDYYEKVLAEEAIQEAIK